MIDIGEWLRRGMAAQRAVDETIERLAPGTPRPREPEFTYSVGDYVWVRAHGNRHELGRIESAAPNLANNTSKVRVRRTKGWPLEPLWRPVVRALSLEELAHNRRLGLIPAAGNPL